MDNLKIVQLDNNDVLIRSSATVSDIYDLLKKNNKLDSLLSIHNERSKEERSKEERSKEERSKEEQKTKKDEKRLRLDLYINNLLSYIENKINYLYSNNYIVLLKEYKIQVSAIDIFLQEYDTEFRIGVDSDLAAFGLDIDFIYTITVENEIPDNLENIFYNLFQVVQEV